MRLEQLAPEHESAFLRMIGDYEENDPETLRDRLGARKWDKKAFLAFVKECEKQRQDWRPGPGKVSVTRYVLIDDDGDICGNGVMRFPLSEDLEARGGNLIFDVPPSKRRQGYGALTLNRMLFEAVRAGMARVLVSCASGDSAARKCIELNRGDLERDEDGLARYWIRFR